MSMALRAFRASLARRSVPLAWRPCRSFSTGMAANDASGSGDASDKQEPGSDKQEPRSFTPRELHQASVEAGGTIDKARQGAGAALALGGAGVLVWHHWAAVASFNCLGGGLIALGAALARPPQRPRKKQEARFKLTLLNNAERWKTDQQALRALVGEEVPQVLVKALQDEGKKEKQQLIEALQQRGKDLQESLKAGEAASSLQERLRPKTFVFDFQANMAGVVRPDAMKKQLEELRDIVTFILHCSSPHDQAVVRLASPGGAVADYGLGAAQLLRLRHQGLKLTACVDKVAASGGYMRLTSLHPRMACAADTVVATPFSLVGSIGVLTAMPNFSKVLKRNDIDFLQITSGKWKRTLDPLSEVTEEAKQKVQEDVRTVHDAFKGLVQEQRESLDVEQVATGEVFLGADAKSKGLVDRLATSDEVLEEFMKVSDVVEVSIATKKKGVRELLEGRMEAAEGAFVSFWRRISGGGVSLESQDPKL
ncbi:unnamed protein product [Effrenium voratum]|uniref:Peptidase S49 domain-containing protein n=1 Tax=Effrenium voratum TaxID=2562239 RepID=A0AA36IGT2_9DINO|nr:unnamed protein product [Effrenium voratum]